MFVTFDFETSGLPTGRGNSDARVNLESYDTCRAVSLSAEKYCSATIMFGAAGVDMTHSYEIVEFDPGL